MTPQLLILLSVFVCVAALCGGAALLLAGNSHSNAEDRLDLLTSAGGAGGRRVEEESPSLLARPAGRNRGVRRDALFAVRQPARVA